MCKCVTRDAFAHSNICAKMPPVGREPTTTTHAPRSLRNKQNEQHERPASFTNLKPIGEPHDFTGAEILIAKIENRFKIGNRFKIRNRFNWGRKTRKSLTINDR